MLAYPSTLIVCVTGNANLFYIDDAAASAATQPAGGESSSGGGLLPQDRPIPQGADTSRLRASYLSGQILSSQNPRGWDYLRQLVYYRLDRQMKMADIANRLDISNSGPTLSYPFQFAINRL